MSYYICETDSCCKIPLRNVPQVCKSLYEMVRDYKDKVELKQPSVDWLDDLLGYANFGGATTWQGYAEIYFDGDKYGDWIVETLDAISPYVEDGSYFEFMGEDGSMWRWVLKNGKCHEISPKISWPDV